MLGGWTPTVTTSWMWDLTIPTDHDFYIQTAASTVLVHNIGGPCDESEPGSQPSSDELREQARDIWEDTTGRRANWDGLQVHH